MSTQSPLGQASSYPTTYDASLLFPIARAANRAAIGITDLPFYGIDTWNAFEISWLNPKGKPQVAVATIIFDCRTPYLLESKSIKLYLNSFNQTSFASAFEVASRMRQDMSKSAQGEVVVELTALTQLTPVTCGIFEGVCIDEEDVECDTYTPSAHLLACNNNQIVSETLVSNLLKSNCPVTGQPDWASVQIGYTGPKLDRGALVSYLVSYRNHDEFHEQCVERIWVDVMNTCKPTELSVYARYTRRGGLDINPYRSTKNMTPTNGRLLRQ